MRRTRHPSLTARRPAILVLSASTGSGHVRAALAVQEALAERDPEARLEHVDVLELAPPWVRRVYGDGFELLAAHAGWIWRSIYGFTDGAGTDGARWGPVARRLLFQRLERLLISADWRICLCTHFLPPQLAAGLRWVPPFALAVTDFELHRYWVQPRIALTFVAREEMARELGRRLPGARALVTGIPVSPAFSELPSRPAARRALAIDPRQPVALVVGGGFGLDVEVHVHAALAARVPGLQVLAVCGSNRQARERLRAERLPPERLRVFGYVTDIERLMVVADVVVGKPGGLTASEALAVGRPLVLTRPIPGHEAANARVLTAAGVALSATSSPDLAPTLERLFLEPGLLGRLSATARLAGRPDAARDIAAAILPRRETHRPARPLVSHRSHAATHVAA